MAFLTEKGKGKGPKSGWLGIVKETDVSFTRPVLDFRITLEARNPAIHCLRQDRVEAGTDLFSSWVVEIASGRIGNRRAVAELCRS